MSSIDAVTGNFNSFLDKLDPASPNYIDINKITGDYLNLEIGMIGGFTHGRMANVTIDVTAQDLSNPYLAITDLTSYTDSNTTSRSGSSVSNVGCGIVNDYFVYNTLDCPSNRLNYIWKNSTTATTDLNQAACIEVMEMTEASLALRYATFCADVTCASDCATAKTKFAYIKGYDNSRREAYHELALAVTGIRTEM